VPLRTQTPEWDPAFTAAYFDHYGLYAFGRQPEAIQWDLAQLAGSLSLVTEAPPLSDMLAEGLPARYARHRALAALVQEWAKRRFALFAEEGYASHTLTCVANTGGISVADLNKELGRQAAAISNGYGDLKEKTFRIAHMGDTQEWEIRGLLATIDRILKLT